MTSALARRKGINERHSGSSAAAAAAAAAEGGEGGEGDMMSA
jgi:hypothetical protein